jgi:hypothetical protein
MGSEFAKWSRHGSGMDTPSLSLDELFEAWHCGTPAHVSPTSPF